MIRIFLFLSIFLSLAYAELKVSGHLDLDSQAYLNKREQKHSSSFTAKQTLELEYTKDEVTVFTKVYAQEAYHDFLHSEDDTQRTFARVDELYLKYAFDNDSIQVGKSIEFWGSLELRNIVDGFNPNEFRDDMFKTNKLGVWNASYSHYTDDGEFSLQVKLAEPNQKMAGYPYVYYVFPQAVQYDDSLHTSKSENRPSIYLSYAGTTDTEYALDYAFIYENGYDSQRYFSQSIPQTYFQNAYTVDKFMTYNTLVVGATLIKLEALYAVVDGSEPISDYSHIALGVEYSLEDFEGGTTLGLLSEYYKYSTYEDGKYTDIELFETMQDDIFFGLRYTLNNAEDSSLVGGVIHDLEYDEQVYYVEFSSRIFDSFTMDLDYYYIEPSKKAQTAYAFLGRHQRIGLNIAYYF